MPLLLRLRIFLTRAKPCIVIGAHFPLQIDCIFPEFLSVGALLWRFPADRLSIAYGCRNAKSALTGILHADLAAGAAALGEAERRLIPL